MNIEFAFQTRYLPLWIIVAVGAIFLLAWALRSYERKRVGRLHRFVEASLSDRLLAGFEARVRRPLVWLPLLGGVMLLAAAAQPRWGMDWIETTRGSRDVLVLLDTSESMNAQVPPPSRIERARGKIEALASLCAGDRFGLIAFSGGAVLQCPPTLDHAYFKSVLNAIDTDTLTQEGTDIAAALEEAGQFFREDVERSGKENRPGRAVVLISDGEQVSGDAVEAARKIGEDVAIYVLGIGDPRGSEVTFPDYLKRYARTANINEPHLSRLDEETLSQIALDGKGVYVRNTADNADIERLHQELESLSASSVSGELRMNQVNRYRWPLSIAIALFAAEGLWIFLMPYVRWFRLRRAAKQGETAHAR